MAASLQYVIDSICSSLTVKSVYEIIEARLSQGPFTVGEILPLIRCKDRSLDFGSTKIIADCGARGDSLTPCRPAQEITQLPVKGAPAGA